MDREQRILVAHDHSTSAGWYRYSFTLKSDNPKFTEVRSAYEYLKSISRRFGPFPKPNYPHPRLNGILFQECPSGLKGWLAAFAKDADSLINLHFIFKELNEITTIQVVKG